jgi:hypothetical protein
MSASLKQIEDQARALMPEERAKLAESMLESLYAALAEIEAAWAEQCARFLQVQRGRCGEYSKCV